ncbi:hypothetical protein NOF04DRAFT_1327032 [Fusarium oxysporum II5]|nr:hypothetical protein NOF04DRAFT_1327032 [Fusarium oxysporum II5]
MLYSICNPILYRNGIMNHGSSSVFYTIIHCRDQHNALSILAAAKEGGADFIKCQDTRKSHPLSFYCIDGTLFSPLHLAARRGLDDIVSYLIDQETILNHQETTAVLIVRRGASRGLCSPNLEAFQASIREGLTCLVRIIVEWNGVDVNADLGYGYTPLVLAVYHRKGPIILTLLGLGAHALPAIRRFCNSGSLLLQGSLEINETLELIFLIATERSWGARIHTGVFLQLYRILVSYFLSRVPSYAIRLVQELKQHGLLLTRRGVEMLDLSSLENGNAPG